MTKKSFENDEYLAAVILEHCYGYDFTKFMKGESPDWQSEELGIGIEVIRAISKSEGSDGAFCRKYLKDKTANEARQALGAHDKHKSFNGKIMEYGDGEYEWCISLGHKGLLGGNDLANVLGCALEKKNKLFLKQHFKRFRSNQLFVITLHIADAGMLRTIIDKACHYDKVFFYDFMNVVCIDCSMCHAPNIPDICAEVDRMRENYKSDSNGEL